MAGDSDRLGIRSKKHTIEIIFILFMTHTPLSGDDHDKPMRIVKRKRTGGDVSEAQHVDVTGSSHNTLQ